MAHFAKLGIGNKVLSVEVVHDSIATTEQAGVNFLNNLYKTNDVWKQTYVDKSLRKNFASINYKYNQTLDAFIPPRPFESWFLNETTCLWEAPIEKPTTYNQNLTDLEGNPYPDSYTWNESTEQWELSE